MFTAMNDYGESYMDIPQFRTDVEVIDWDKKNLDKITE